MDPEKIIAAARKIKAAYERDKHARYGLKEPLVLPRVRCRAVGVAPFAWDGPLIHVEPDEDDTVRITIKPYSSSSGVCDGCSLAPDLRGCIEAALFHDPWYAEMDAMAAGTGISQADIRRLGDAVFGALCRAYGAPGPVARVYYNAVRWFGQMFHRARGKLAIAVVVAAAAIVAGCSGGCNSIPDILDGDPPAPVFEESSP